MWKYIQCFCVIIQELDKSMFLKDVNIWYDNSSTNDKLGFLDRITISPEIQIVS